MTKIPNNRPKFDIEERTFQFAKIDKPIRTWFSFDHCNL